jgi:hypothetical protein
MLNVVNFEQRARRPHVSRQPQPPAGINLDLSKLAFRITSLHSKAKQEIDRAILMLDLAAQHGRQIANRMSDPEVRKNFEADLSMIEQLLEITRSMALRL